jgi:hypothetical protein
MDYFTSKLHSQARKILSNRPENKDFVPTWVTFLILKWFHYLYNATPRRTAKMPVAKAKNNAMNTW